MDLLPILITVGRKSILHQGISENSPSTEEDANKMRVGFSAESIGLIRRIELNLLK